MGWQNAHVGGRLSHWGGRWVLLWESRRLRDGVHKHALVLAKSDLYKNEELDMVRAIAAYAIAQATRLHDSAKEAITITADML